MLTPRFVPNVEIEIFSLAVNEFHLEVVISDSTEEENYLRSLMINASAQTVFLCDSEKFNTRSLFTLTTLDKIDIAVFDKPFPDLQCNSKKTIE